MARFQGSDTRLRPGFVLPGLVVALVCAAGAGAGVAVGSSARSPKMCHAPHLTGLTLSAARQRSGRAGCKLQVKGAKLELASTQTVERQSPGAGRRARSVTASLNPLCHGSAAYGPRISEPTVTVGPTRILSGFYFAGGPVAAYSAPGCRRPEPRPEAGVVEVEDATGAVLVRATSAPGHLVEIPLQAGSYTIRGTFLNAEINGAHPTKTESVVIPAGHSVRRDFVLDIR